MELSTISSVSNATLNRFFSLHYLLPFVLAGLAIAHLMALHEHGSQGPKLYIYINYITKRYKSTIKKTLAFILPRFRSKNRIGPHNKEIISILVGSILGDSHGERLSSGGVRFKFQQSIIHKDYLFFLHKKILDLGYTNNTLPYLVKQKLNNKIFESYCFNTYSFSSLI
jgi:LAGLIDADG DNA endonuclease family/Cytochrome b/b6/petB